MLVVEPEKRYSLKQISLHRWMSCQPPLVDDFKDTPTNEQEPSNLDSVVITNMLQLPNLTFDEIAESVHQNTFDHIYAIYNLLVDKLQAKRKEQNRLQHHTNLAYSKYVIIEGVSLLSLLNYVNLSVAEHGKQVLRRE